MTHEAYYLYIDQDSSRNAIPDNSILIEQSEAVGRLKKSVSLKYVTAVGTFHVFNQGRERPNIGLVKVQSVTLWSDPEHPIADKIRSLSGEHD